MLPACSALNLPPAGPERQPQVVVRAAGAHAAPARRVPPVLDVPFRELPGRGPEQLRPRLLRGGVQQGEVELRHPQALGEQRRRALPDGPERAAKIAEAKRLYAPARVHYERIEPIAESFPALDTAIDIRESSLEDIFVDLVEERVS